MIAAGKLNRRVRIAIPTVGDPDERGERPITWATTFARRWACLEPISARTIEQAKSFSATVSHTITLRYLQGISVRHRVESGDRVFAINGIIDPKDSHEDTVLYVTERTS